MQQRIRCPLPSLSPRPEGREPERGARSIVSPSCSELQQLQLLAASCSFLQPVAANYSESHRFVAGLREFHAFQAPTSFAVKPSLTSSRPLAASCSGLHFNLPLRFLRYLGVKYLQLLAASCSKLQRLAAGWGSCLCFHFSLSLRLLRYLGVKYFQPLAASCSELHLPLRNGLMRPPMP